MIQLPYTYEVIQADDRSTLLSYKSPGRQDILKWVLTPRQGETLEQVAVMYNPSAEWLDMELARVVPSVGASGGYTPPEPEPETLESVKRDKLAEIAAARYEEEVGGVTVGGITIATDRQTQSIITGAFISMSQGLLASVDWKAENGTWVKLNLTQLTPIAQAVVGHVQGCFTKESVLAEQVAVATTIADVKAIKYTAGV